VLTRVIRFLSRQRLVDGIFNWYLGLLPPKLVLEPTPVRPMNSRRAASLVED
jgi:hypothetical protein